jgi:hypothetical protein
MARVMWCGVILLAGCGRSPAEIPRPIVDLPIDSDTPVFVDTDTGVAPQTCTDPALAAIVADAAQWTLAGACGGATLAARNADATAGLLLTVQLPAGVRTPGERFSFDVTDPTPDDFVELQLGEHLFGGFCDDVAPEPPPAIASTLPPRRGVIRVEVTASAGEAGPDGSTPFTATVTVGSLVIGTPEASCAVPDLRFVDVRLGWFPG